MPRIYRNKRDANEVAIFDALKDAGRGPVRFQDFDIGATHIDGYGVMIDCKGRYGQLTEVQQQLAAIFGDRFTAARTPQDALRACGIQVDER